MVLSVAAVGPSDRIEAAGGNFFERLPEDHDVQAARQHLLFSHTT